MGSIYPKNNKSVWIGAPVCKTRIEANEFFKNHSDICDFWLMDWNLVRNNLNSKYLTIGELCNYKILYDLPGAGYSGRISYFFFCNRPIIKLKDGYKYWFDDYINKNSLLYVNSFNEMLNKTKEILNNEDLYLELSNNIKEIGKKYINKDNALDYLSKIINNI